MTMHPDFYANNHTGRNYPCIQYKKYLNIKFISLCQRYPAWYWTIITFVSCKVINIKWWVAYIINLKETFFSQNSDCFSLIKSLPLRRACKLYDVQRLINKLNKHLIELKFIVTVHGIHWDTNLYYNKPIKKLCCTLIVLYSCFFFYYIFVYAKILIYNNSISNPTYIIILPRFICLNIFNMYCTKVRVR